jgi:ribosomal protein S6--L-glutamate ligase
MRIALLSRNPSLYSTSRLMLAGRARGHQIDVLDPLELQTVVAPGTPSLHRAGVPLARYDVALPRIGASITGYGVSIVRQFEQQLVPVINGSVPIARTRDKVRTLALLARHGIPVPRTVCTRSLAGLDAALELVGGCPAIVKLQHGTQGIGTMIAETPQALHSLIETLWAMGQEIVLQEYVRESEGRDIRALVVAGRLIAAMRRQARPGEFRSNLHRGGTGDALTLPARYRTCALKALQPGRGGDQQLARAGGHRAGHRSGRGPGHRGSGRAACGCAAGHYRREPARTRA